jgi:hypothetical protein
MCLCRSISLTEQFPPQRSPWRHSLARADRAIKHRNTFLHPVPVVRIGPRGLYGGAAPGGASSQRRGYSERPLTVESLSQLRADLEEAAAGWQDILLSLGNDVLP